MAKAALVILADTETHADRARVVNALLTAKEFKENNDEIRVIFDGAGTKWVPELANVQDQSHRLYEAVKDTITGACAFCAAAFQVKEEIASSGVPLLEEYSHHPSLRTLVANDFQVITF